MQLISVIEINEFGELLSKYVSIFQRIKIYSIQMRKRINIFSVKNEYHFSYFKLWFQLLGVY